MREERIGVLLLNTGTTDAPEPGPTRRYLRQFLSDPRVLDIPAVTRQLLLNTVILPFRPKRSAAAYAKVWTSDGSPLIVVTERLRDALQHEMPHVTFAIGMRYGNPSIPAAVDALREAAVDRIIAAPLFPQYASAATGSVVEEVYRLAGGPWNVDFVSMVPPFYDDAGFLDAWDAVARPVLADFAPDYVLMSYHGLPERHVRKSDPTGQWCLERDDCCARRVPENRYCYRRQCLETSDLIAERLGLDADRRDTSFQSRLGRDPWLKPATDERVPELAKQGVKRLAVLCPSFTADCLETLEEIGMGAEEAFLEAGGEAFRLVPCLNSHPAWVKALADLLRRL